MHHQKISDKIKTWHEAADIVRLLKAEGKKAVFTNGCFDLLHKGHVDYLSKAADLGDLLVVGINTDESVKRLGKSLSRPIQDENSRAYIMAALESVGIVVMFNEDTPLELINMLRPDVLVKGSDYNAEDIVGYDIVMADGGKVSTINFIPGYSTSLIEKKILESK